MEKKIAVQKLVSIIHHLHNKTIDFNEAKKQAYDIFKSIEDISSENMFNLIFTILTEYFFDPAKKARIILQNNEISKDDLVFAHQFIQKSHLLKMLFLSNYYPRSLLVKSAINLLDFMQKNPQYLSKILRGEIVGPMMLEIHPTNATCIYRCKMCIWCGGENKIDPISHFYKTEKLLTVNKWFKILEEAKNLGTKQVVFSGGGETLLSQTMIKSVLDKANSIGLETMIYTNGRTLYNVNQTLLNSILNSTWLRISLHSATPEIYSKIINRPLKANDLEFVLNGIHKIVSLNKQTKGKLKIGIGIVLQELNYTEITNITKLCSNLKIDFLDIRVDCIGVTKKLSKYQYEQMLESLRELRTNVEAGQLEFKISFADDLLIAMDQWTQIELTRPKRCLIPLIRPAIDPFGIVGSCDSIGEPYTRSKSPIEYTLGQINDGCSFVDIMRNTAGTELGIKCKFCMPGQISLNALLEKLLDDFRIGIKPYNQPFCFNIS